ncbi:carbamoyl-phosphate synthase large subunit [bacterium]|jgi:carbamoyl-phosphate synthase large subunit|nr:carbamoyl-phosphate synthase large subunit [bacterium]
MPKRTDIKKILLIGSGPIVIGQACEFDYSGTQACKTLREDGYKIVLVNSNPATIMTDPSFSDATYIEPLTVESVSKIIEKERPDAVLPTLGGQTALNLAIELDKAGVLQKYNVELLGASVDVINKAEDRLAFKKAMESIDVACARSDVSYTIEDAKKLATEIGYPCVVRPAFTLGGIGGGIAYNVEELESIAASGLQNSIISEVLIEESIIGWKEYELEVMRDKADNVVIICSIENLDPMGVHTGDSITVAPAQTLTDKEYQRLRDISLKIIREIGVETGGSNIQFAINPKDGRVIVIEMNPRVSRSSALASKATGFPIAKFAAKLAVGYTLDELDNDITKKTPASFEPTIDYCVVKLPRFNFDKFPLSPPVLGTAMKSVGETMAIGRTFKEALQKGIRGLEIKKCGLTDNLKNDPQSLIKNLITPHPFRIFSIAEAFTNGMSLEEVHDYTKVDPWFLFHIKEIINLTSNLSLSDLKSAKRMGFSDKQLSEHFNFKSELEFREERKKQVIPTYKIVDTCAGEFEAFTPYYYSTYEEEDESVVTENKKVMILGSGPNRIGQGVEFDYCCVHASFAASEEGFESIMVNSNPETVSTDFDISDKLYFEPVTVEDVLNIYEKEKPEGIIVQLGGQTPLNISKTLEKAGVNILGTSPESIDIAEDRDRFKKLLDKLNLVQPQNGTATKLSEALDISRKIGFPCVVRPSYVIGGSSMEIVYDEESLTHYISKAINVSPEHPILVDQYLEDATELDVDALSDGTDCVIAGIMEHIEEAGIHSGDSACTLPPISVSESLQNELKKATYNLAKELNVVGLINVQFAIKNNKVFIIEVNPRASRTVPFISKATGVSWSKLATKIMLGKTIKELNIKEIKLPFVAVKEAVLPFKRFPGSDILLGPEMKSTGEVMGIDKDFGMAFLKSQLGAGQEIPSKGQVFISVKNKDKPKIIEFTTKLIELGFGIIATKGTAIFLKEHNLTVNSVHKVSEGRPHIVDKIKNGEIQLVFNTPQGKKPLEDELKIRKNALIQNIPVVTTISGATATVKAIDVYGKQAISVKPLQDYYKDI